MRERLAYLILVGMLIIVTLFVFAVIGKGEYQPPTGSQESPWPIPHEVLL